MNPHQPRALVVDDNEAILRVHARALTGKGFRVEMASSGEAAMRAVQKQSFDVILTDIDMPGMNGIRLLEQVRAHDLDVPTIMITGTPCVDTAAAAMEHGASRYLTKPVEMGMLVKVAKEAVTQHRAAKARRQALELAGGVERFVGNREGLTTNFNRALDSLYVAYQPIVCLTKGTVYAHEALLRSRESTLPGPGEVLDAAEELGRIHDLGRVIRARAVEPIGELPKDVSLFINLHPLDLMDPQLYATDTPLVAVASRIVLEITERASLAGIPDVQARVASLRRLGYRIAIDDLGAGYSGLTSFALLQPDVVKLDMALVRGIDTDPTKQVLVRALIEMSKELGITVTGEGLETVEERDELRRAGCDLMQGYLFARPSNPIPKPSF